jgi:methylthioribose-1-phosphate isomerase
MKDLRTLEWVGGNDGHLRLIDQTRLPAELVHLDCRDPETVWEAIKQLRVRGAPAIGIAAAYGICLGLQTVDTSDEAAFFTRLQEVTDYLATSRPTAVNLFWAIKRMIQRALDLRQAGQAPPAIAEALLDEARAIEEEDRQMCRAIGRHGAELLGENAAVLTHCNAGGLATADYGTALAVIYSAVESGKTVQVYADETRPLLQGARLTAWELKQRNIPCTLICDSMAPVVMQQGKVTAVVTGADRITANGDVANKIGTYGVALAAAAHRIPFYVAAPSSTFDLSLASGAEIPIEQRDPEEITNGLGRAIAPEGIDVYNPAFDVTPAQLVTALICEHGVIRPVDGENIATMLGSAAG